MIYKNLPVRVNFDRVNFGLVRVWLILKLGWLGFGKLGHIGWLGFWQNGGVCVLWTPCAEIAET